MVELLLTYCWSNVDIIAYHRESNELKSAIAVVEDNGKDCIGHHSQKDGKRQDPSLWDIFQCWLWNLFLIFIHSYNYNVHWKLIEYLTCNIERTQPEASPAFPSSNLQVLLLCLARINSWSIFITFGLFQSLEAYDLCWQFKYFILNVVVEPVEEPPWLQSQPRHA